MNGAHIMHPHLTSSNHLPPKTHIYSYDRVQENALAQGRYEQALSVLEIESMLPRRILEDGRFFPRYGF